MKKTISLFLLTFLSISFNLQAQVFPTDTILLSKGDINKLINIVILPDGYTATQLDTFINDANTLVNYFFSQQPYSNYKNYFNAFAIKVFIEGGVIGFSIYLMMFFYTLKINTRLLYFLRTRKDKQGYAKALLQQSMKTLV